MITMEPHSASRDKAATNPLELWLGAMVSSQAFNSWNCDATNLRFHKLWHPTALSTKPDRYLAVSGR